MNHLIASTEHNPRVAVLNERDLPASSECVLLWVQRAQRAHDNPARNLAVELANELNLPVIAVFCLVDDYPEATLRSMQFMAEGLDELADAFSSQHIGWILATGDPVKRIQALAHSMKAAIVVTDLDPLRTGRQWRLDLSKLLDIPFLEVDSDVVVPTSLNPKLEYAARTIRPKLERYFDQFLVPQVERRAQQHSSLREGGSATTAISRFDLDTSVPAAPDLNGGYRQAKKRLGQFVEQRFAKYDTERQRADIDAGTGLSPYLHFGQIGPVEIALAAMDVGSPKPALDSFLDELIVQRELSINFAIHNAHYDKYSGLPEWARSSLERHRDDPRADQYTQGEFDSARSDDALWNAAQTQLRNEGWMPNRLRMYWGKQILLWSPSPQHAWSTTIGLNNRYFVDGRDANSYANVGWCIGGLHDRPFGPERPVTGLVRPMGMGAMKRTFDVKAYIAAITERWGEAGK